MKWAPVLFGILALVLWEAAVRIGDVPAYQLPGPIAIVGAFAADPVGLLQSLASLQVTPLPAIAPLIIIWVGEPFVALVVCATIVAFFPLFANTVTGLASPPPELNDLFRLYGARRWHTMTLLRLPAALPFFLSGLRISGGLALVGAVVAELVAGSGGFASGLAYRILEASFRLEMPRMFAALVLLALAGILLNFGLGALGQAILRRRGLA
jgi:NitT/TauT family transport system permease protein